MNTSPSGQTSKSAERFVAAPSCARSVVFACRAALFLLLPLFGCAGERNAENASTATAPTPAAGETTTGGDGGALPPVTSGAEQDIDVAPYDREIDRLDDLAEKNPSDEAGRKALAKAYLARAHALARAKRYKGALGDYRRVMRYDPDNEEAPQMSAAIINFLTDAGGEDDAEVVSEVDAPAPRQVTPETMSDEAPVVTDNNSGGDAKGRAAETPANANRRQAPPSDRRRS